MVNKGIYFESGKFIFLIIFLTSFFILYSCSSPSTFLSEREKKFGTNGKNKWVFHRLSDRDKGTSLAFPGYIIGIEKAWRGKIGAPKRKEIRKGNALEVYSFDSLNIGENLGREKMRKLDDPKSMFISSIFEFSYLNSSVDRIGIETIYDAYSPKFLLEPKNAFDSSFSCLDVFSKELKNEVKEKEITHVFLFAMGWNSDQQEAIRNFNSLFLKLINNVDSSGVDFNPIFIGLTWPSMWNSGKSNVFSFFNKTNDADEIGMTWGNIILNKIIPSAIENEKTSVVVLGHSFGAKLTSRAVMSASMLKFDSPSVDLLINLQSAYSINRFSRKKGVEKTDDYVNWSNYVDNIGLLCSSYDKAVTKGFYSPFGGSIRAYKKVKKNQELYENIKLRDSPYSVRFTNNKEFLFVNGSDIIKTCAYKKGGEAHSDIYNKEVSELLWQLVHSSTY